MTRSRYKLESFVQRLYPFHMIEDAIEFAFRRGQITWSAWLFLTKQETQEDKDANLERVWIQSA